MNNGGMMFLVYVSAAVRRMSQEELVALLRQCRDNNARLEVTGMLLHKDGNFMQALEGPSAAVEELSRKIQTDPRHHHVMTLIQGPLEQRHFDGWSMGFHNIDLLNDADRLSVSPFLNEPFTEAAYRTAPNKALKLLMSFKRDMR